MSFETPPPYGDDRENLPPIPPEFEEAAPPIPEKSNTFRNWAIGSFLIHVMSAFIVIGFLAAPISALVGLIGMAAAKDPESRARMGGLATGAGLALLAAAGICIALLTSANSTV
jgi:hypothetical protein